MHMCAMRCFVPRRAVLCTGPKERGIRLFTVHVRRGAPDVQDPGWNSLSKLNCISACIQVSWKMAG
jgi:branched-chain amino acid aminotransferase